MTSTQPSTELRIADLLAALSLVTDMGIGRAPEAAMQSCILATCLAERMGLGRQEISDVYYASLLRYVGCTAFAHEEAAMAGGDELDARAETTRMDFSKPGDLLGYHLLRVGSGQPPLRRAALVALALPRSAASLKELIASHCEVGVGMARRLGLSAAVELALGQIFERWDGKGGPNKLKGEQLSLPVRFAHVATQAVAFLQTDGPEAALTVVRGRTGGWFDPAICDAFAAHGSTLMAEMAEGDVWDTVLAVEPAPLHTVADQRIDDIARAFADMVDLKTPFLRGHSSEVAELAETAAGMIGFSDTDIVQLRRAALLHDLGRVGVPNGIWGKTGALTGADWERVRLHPYHTERILSRSSVLAPLARIAGMHHERNDGSGYHRAADGTAIPLAARVLAAADAYGAMIQPRPYRPALSPRSAADTLSTEIDRGRIDRQSGRAVLEAAGHRQGSRRGGWPAGLSDREVEVLRLIARGSSYRDVASELTISPRTAAHHVQHIYNKIGVSTRAGAAMFAMEHDLLPRR